MPGMGMNPMGANPFAALARLGAMGAPGATPGVPPTGTAPGMGGFLAGHPNRDQLQTEFSDLMQRVNAFNATYGNQGADPGNPGNPGNPPAPNPVLQRARFASQLAQLSAMGFTNEAACLRALAQHEGRVDAAIDALLSGNGGDDNP